MVTNKTIFQKYKKNFNIFIGLLRMYLAFIVVNSHCYRPSKYMKNKIYILRILKNNIHVPTFFIISFYFCHNLFISKDIKKIKLRFKRMIIPYFLWPIIVWIINNFISYIFHWKIDKSFNALKIQILTGHFYLPALWFQYNLIFITIFVLIIELLIKEYKLLILINLEIIAYYFQYSNLNFNIFSKYDYNRKYPFGRFFEVIPFCFTGYLLSYLKIITYLKKNIIKSIYILLLILILLIKYVIFSEVKGFMYQGIRLHMISLIIFCIFSLMPSEKIKNEYIINIVKLITNNTPGIYYLHVPIRNYLKNVIILIKKRTLFGSLIIYIICYFISLFGIKVFGKTILKNLFQ